jgi:flagellar L-ring protein precursor FlgH
MAKTGFRRWLPAITLCAGLGLPVPSDGQSLWTVRDPSKSHLFLDQQARQIGDVLTIVIREVTDVQNKDQRNLGRDSTHAGGLSITGSLGGVLGTAEGDSQADVNLSDRGNFAGSSETKIEREFVDRITVRVTDVLPNGILRVRGQRHQVIGNETRDLNVCGLVRPQDIRADNSVESRYIADFQMQYAAAGEDTEFTARGWLGRCWQKIRP